MGSHLALLALSFALGQSPPDAPAVDLPVKAATVFSDRARVTRRGDVKLKAGTQKVRLPLLPVGIDTASVRLEATGATVRRVELRRADEDEFPRNEARKLLDTLDALHDQDAALADQLEALNQERALLLNLRPYSAPQADPKVAPVTLEPGGWRPAIKFVDTRLATNADARKDLIAKQRALRKDLAEASAKALQLASTNTGKPGWVPEATLTSDGGAAALSLVYMAPNARWYPAYDVRFSPGKNEVEVDFAALVSQQTGEDWEAANLTLSTAVPATATALPKLLSWKIGSRDEFVPQPRAKPSPTPPAPPPPSTPAQPPVPMQSDDDLRAMLSRAASGAPASATGASSPNDAMQRQSIDESVRQLTQLYQQASSQGDVVRLQCIAQRLSAAQRMQAMARTNRGPAGPLAQQTSQLLAQAAQCAGQQAEQVAEEDAVAYGAEAGAKEELDEAPRPAAPPPPPAAYEPSRRAPMAVETSEAVRPRKKSKAEAAPEYLAFSAPGSWRPPSYAPDLPASLAGGYDFTYASARPEAVRSGAEARRVPLHAARFPAIPLVTVLPALQKSAYFIADVTNTSERPLLQGMANLYVGADLQGQALLATTAKGEKVALPLGVDDAIRVERQVNPVVAESGVFSKKDVTVYEVRIELLNPHKTAVQAKVVDQVPLKGNQNVEVKLEKMDPWAVQNEAEGTLEWHLTLPPGKKQLVTFRYSLARPSGAQVWQH